MTNRPTFLKSRGGPKFMHLCCKCDRWGAFGVDVNLRKAMDEQNVDLAGTWYCFEHWPGRVTNAV